MKKSLLISAILFTLPAASQTIRTPGSFAYTRLTAYSQQFSDAFSVAGNRASLPAVKTFSAGVYTERRFGLSDLGAHAATIVLPTASGHFALQGDYLGSFAYHESLLGLAYGRQLGEKVSVGVQFNYFTLRAAGYGGASAVSVDAGMTMQLTTQLKVGIQACNAVRSAWDKEVSAVLPATYRAGFGYDLSPQVFLGAEAEKTGNEPIGVNAGVHYQVAQKLVTRAGIRTATSLFYLGFGVQLGRFRIDVTASVHPHLGLSPGLLLLYSSPE